MNDGQGGLGAGSCFDEDFAYVKALAAREIDDAEEAEFVLEQIYRTLLNINPAKYDVARVRAAAGRHVGELFALRMGLRDQIASWHARGLMSPGAERALRNTFRACRYAGDMMGELIAPRREGQDGEPVAKRAFSGSTETQIHPRYAGEGAVTFKSGDVLLMRGGMHNSAAIARIGDVDSQFSHVGIVHIGKDGAESVVEALIEEGTVIATLDHVLEQGLARLVLLRHRDPALAHAAATTIHEVASAALARNRPILYDFSMRLEGYDELFCSKLIRMAFDHGSAGRIMLPTFPTRISMRNRDFLDRVGVKASTTFAPGDMELEPLFDVVAEWRDFERTARVRLQDLLMDKLFEWMEQHGYRFRETFAIRLISVLGRFSSYLSRDAKEILADVVPKVPVNMSRRTIAAVAMLHKTAEPILGHLLELERLSMANYGRPLHPRQVAAELETYRGEFGRSLGYLKS
ncbi:MAG: hypothetical protein GC150_15565 [Rhizobiales bacterium]|nr:hypothetical protein [Hyphomicrobiales bacterium]